MISFCRGMAISCGFLCRFFKFSAFLLLLYGLILSANALDVKAPDPAAAKPAAEAAEKPAAGAGAFTPDTTYIVLGIDDFKGDQAVKVVSNVEYTQVKKDIDIDNKAMKEAYEHVKNAYYEKYDKEYKAARDQLMKASANKNSNQGGQQRQQLKRNIPPFLLKKPEPEEIHFFGEYKNSAEAETQRQNFETREAARVAKVISDQAKAAEPGLQFELKKQVFKKKEKATCPKELTDQLQAEFDKIKTAMVASGNATYKEEKPVQASTRKVTALGSQPIGELKRPKQGTTLGGK